VVLEVILVTYATLKNYWTYQIHNFGASEDNDKLIRFWGQKIKVEGHEDGQKSLCCHDGWMDGWMVGWVSWL